MGLALEKNLMPFRQFDSQLINERGARLHDRLLISPWQGRKLELILTRTRYQLIPHKEYKCTQQGTNIYLPTLTGKDFDLDLELVASTSGDYDTNGRYLLRANASRPFRINGTYCYEAFVERGDVIDIGHNRLFIRKNVEDLVAADETQGFLSNTKLVASTLNILLEGETGTGKSRLAKMIHEQSGRIGKFVQINLSSFSPGLIESELFGHVKGAFTGAVMGKRGAFLEANLGTLFLDEIDSLPLDLQIKLLLFLDTKQVRAVGAEHDEKTDVRLIFAAGRNLKRMIDQGLFRKDFYYRIASGAILYMQPLRYNKKKIIGLCDRFSQGEGVFIPKSLVEFYTTLAWPGNVRQLLGHLHKKMVIHGERKLFFDECDQELLLQKETQMHLYEDKGVMTMEELKVNYAYNVFMRLDGNVYQAAKALGVTSNTLRALVKKRTNPPE